MTAVTVTGGGYAGVVDLIDTASEPRRRQIEAYRAMNPARRVEIALALSEELRSIAIDGIKGRNPAFHDRQVRAELLRILHGANLADKLAALPSAR